MEYTLRIGCSRLFWCIHGLNPLPSWCHKNFANWFERHSTARNCIVSFNWDVAAEAALQNAGLGWSYSLSSTAIAVLKPHGSINWNGYLRTNLTNEFGLWYPIGAGSKLSYLPDTPLVNPDQDVVTPDLMHMIFPGEPDSAEKDEDLKLIWDQVKEALESSNRVVFIGYSLPDYDSYASGFLRRFVQGKAIEVYNPSPDHLKRYQDLLGPNVEAYPIGFGQSPYGKS